MAHKEWPANDYAVGSIIQATISDEYTRTLSIPETARVLDVGCGDGAYSRKILAKVPCGEVLGVDASANMLKLAREVSREFPNFSVREADITALDMYDTFDQAVSFWCLQWVQDIRAAFESIMHALVPGGKLLALLPAGHDPYILGYYALRDSGEFPQLAHFVPPMRYELLENLQAMLASIPCRRLTVERTSHTVTLPSLDTYRKFVNGLAFYHGQMSEAEVHAINEALVAHFDAECRQQFAGEYRFYIDTLVVTGEK